MIIIIFIFINIIDISKKIDVPIEIIILYTTFEFLILINNINFLYANKNFYQKVFIFYF